MKYLKLFEGYLDIIKKISEGIDWEEDIEEYEEGEQLTRSNAKRGMNVICVEDCVNGYNPNRMVKGFVEYTIDDDYYLPINKGDEKIINGIGEFGWFKDTPGGWGGYEYKNFEII